MSNVTALMAMMAAMQSGVAIQGDYRIPRRGYGSGPSSSLTDSQRKARKKKNQARKKSNRKNRK